MKHLIVILLIGILALTGCGKQPIITQEAKEYGYFNFENLEWGMTPAEVMKKLDKKESDFTITQDPVLHTDIGETIYKLDNTKYQKRKATIEYIFLGIIGTVNDQALRSVQITFIDEINEEEADKIWNTIEAEIQAYDIAVAKDAFEESNKKVTSKTKTVDLPQEIQDKTNAYARKLFRDMEKTGVDVPLDIDRYEFTRSSNPLLSQVKASYQLISDGKEIFVVSFDGSGIAYTKLYSRLADELNLVE